MILGKKFTSSLKFNLLLFPNKRFYKYNRFFIKNSEHTWGLDVKTVLAPPDFQRNNWGNSEFQKVRSDVRFQNLEASWIRQRRWGIDDAITELGNHSLVTQIHQMFEELKASIPSTDGFRYVSPSSPALNFDCGRFKIAFNETTGAISSLKDSKTDIDWVSNDDLLLLEYRTYDANDYSNFMLNYNYMGWFYYFDDLDDFDKVGINLYNAKRRIIHPKLDQFWVKNLTDNSNVKDNLIGTQFLLRLVFPQELIEVAGAPQFVWISLVVPSVDSTLNLTLQVFNKTTTRLPETMYFRFKPNASSSSLQFINTTWVMEKLGQPVDPSIVVTGGAKHVHYVSDGGMTYFAQTKASFSSSQIATSPKTNYSFQIKSSETGLICFGEPNAFPVPTNLNPNFHEGASFILWNNLWNTNYIMYFPFLAEEASIKYRFQLQFN